MRTITKDIQLNIDGNSENFRLTKPDAFSGVEILRLLLRLQDRQSAPSVLDLITSLSSDELRSVMTSCLNRTEVLLPAGQPKRPEHDLKALITKRQDFR